MFWVTLIIGVIILSLAIYYGPWATSKNPSEREKFRLILMVGTAVILLLRLIRNWLD